MNHPIPDRIDRHIVRRRPVQIQQTHIIQHRIGIAHRRELWRDIRVGTDRIGLDRAVSCGGSSTDAPGEVGARGLGGGGAGELEPGAKSGGGPGGGFLGCGADDVARGEALDGYGYGWRSLRY